MLSRLKAVLAFGAVAAAMVTLGGCALAPATILPAVAGAAPVVVEDWGTGRRDSFWLARYDDVVEAVLGAAEELSLQITNQESEEDKTTLRFVDARDAAITVRIERRTETVTQVHFDAGSRELSGLASLLGRQTIDELHKADAFLVDWSDAPEPGPK